MSFKDHKLSEEAIEEIQDCFELIIRISNKLSRDERNAIMGIVSKRTAEAEYYRAKLKELGVKV